MNKEVVDVWDAFLNTLKNRGLAELNWKIGADVRAQLIGYFKEKIDAGASLPNLLDYIYRFPKKNAVGTA